MMTSAQVVETLVNVTSNSPSQDYTHPDDHNLPNYNVKNVAKKTAEKATKTIAEKAGQKVGEFTVEKGSKQIRKLLQERKKQKPLSQGAKKNLQIFCQPQHQKNQTLL